MSVPNEYPRKKEIIKAIASLPEERFQVALRGLGMNDRQEVITLRERLGLMTESKKCPCTSALDVNQLNPMFRFGEQPTLFGIGAMNPKQLSPTFIGTDEESTDFFAGDDTPYKWSERQNRCQRCGCSPCKCGAVNDARPVRKRHLAFMRTQRMANMESRLARKIAHAKVKLARLQKRRDQLQKFSETKVGDAAAAFISQELNRTNSKIDRLQNAIPRAEDAVRKIREVRTSIESKNKVSQFKGMAYIPEGLGPLLRTQVRFVNGTVVYRPAYDSYPVTV